MVGGHRVTPTYNLYLDDDGRAYGKDLALESGAAKPKEETSMFSTFEKFFRNLVPPGGGIVR